MRAMLRRAARRTGGFAASALTLMVIAVAAVWVSGAPASGDEARPIRVGILQAPVGKAAMLREVMLMLIAEQNKKGGLLSRKLEPVWVESDCAPEVIAPAAAQGLLGQDKVDVIFGPNTSRGRKGLLPLLAEKNTVLFYPTASEGEEGARNIFYTGATPNQQAIPAIDYLAEELHVERWVLAGTNAVFPRTLNKILEAYLKSRGVKAEDIMISAVSRGHKDWDGTVADIKAFGAKGRKTAVLSTVMGPAQAAFSAALARHGVTAAESPVMVLTLGQEAFASYDKAPLAGNFVPRNYAMSISTPDNKAFIERWRAFAKDETAPVTDAMEAHYIGFYMWVKAVEKAGTTDADKVIAALPGIKQANLTGGISQMLPNHHITKPVYIGTITPEGGFDVVWKSKDLIPGDAWSDYLEGSRTLKADWGEYNCADFDTAKNVCLTPPPQVPAKQAPAKAQ